ncbi:MAG: LysR family transcriptional regulator [Coriobacteriales bacterium]
MDTGILQEFAELAKRLNFTETARLLNMSQPTLSKHISSFERELRIELFDRSGSMLRLTRAGTELLPHAYKIIESQKDFYAVVKALRSAPPPQLRVGGFVDEELVSQTLSNMLVAMSENHGRNFLEVRPAKHRLPPNCSWKATSTSCSITPTNTMTLTRYSIPSPSGRFGGSPW